MCDKDTLKGVTATPLTVTLILSTGVPSEDRLNVRLSRLTVPSAPIQPVLSGPECQLQRPVEQHSSGRGRKRTSSHVGLLRDLG